MFPQLFFLVFSSFFFLRAAGEITYRETVESVRNSPFIGRVGALALESARVGEDFEERELSLSDREACRFAIRSHARKRRARTQAESFPASGN